MAPSKITDHTADKVNRNSKQTISRQQSITAEEMDSSRTARRRDTAMSPTPEPATAAMVDVSSWAQRGLVLENKDLRRTLEMTKSAHAAQLAQIAKRQRTEKEELEVKLEAEMCRQEANQRNLNELAANLEEARKENAKLVEKDQALHKQLTTRIEENRKLAGEFQQASNVIKSTQDEVETLKETQKDLIARENRVAVVLNEQHSKVMNLSKAYHILETDNKQLQAAFESANSELARLKARMSGILETLASVVRDNGDEEGPGIRLDGKVARNVSTGLSNVVEGRKRSRSSDQRALALSESPNPRDTNTPILGEEPGQDGQQRSPITRDFAKDSSLGLRDSLNADRLLPDALTESRGKSARTKRRRIVSDPDTVDALSQPIQYQVKEEPSSTDVTMVDRTAFQVAADGTTTLEIEETTQVVEVEVPIRDAVGASANKISDAGEESPERAAVESAIDGQRDEQRLGGAREEDEIIVNKPRPKTYAKKRKALNEEQIASDRPETPAPRNKAASSIRESAVPLALSTPLTGRSKSSPKTTTPYITRAKTGISSTTALDSTNQGSPFSKKRQQVITSKEHEDIQKSLAMVQVKEEVPDSMYDGRPRITGGDDEEDPLCI